MIRIIHISKDDEATPNEKDCFAWFNTCCDMFMTYSGEQIWESWDEFESAYNDDGDDYYEIERFRKLYG